MKYVAMLLATLFISGTANATDWSTLSKKKQTQLGLYMTPAQAFEATTKADSKAVFIDVRTREEVNFLGTPTTIDANIPYMKLNEWFAWNEKKSNFKMEVNSEFQDAIAELITARKMNKDAQIILMCRSGSRSAKAADLLAKLGYTNVYSVTEGFEGDKAKQGDSKGQRVVNGWKNSDLPWTYKLTKSKMYQVGS